jgi:hypothetical protein
MPAVMWSNLPYSSKELTLGTRENTILKKVETPAAAQSPYSLVYI